MKREIKLLDHSIQRTRQKLATFETRYEMNSKEFERKFNAGEVAETLDYLDWWMEIESLRQLEYRRTILKEAKLK